MLAVKRQNGHTDKDHARFVLRSRFVAIKVTFQNLLPMNATTCGVGYPYWLK